MKYLWILLLIGLIGCEVTNPRHPDYKPKVKFSHEREWYGAYSGREALGILWDARVEQERELKKLRDEIEELIEGIKNIPIPPEPCEICGRTILIEYLLFEGDEKLTTTKRSEWTEKIGDEPEKVLVMFNDTTEFWQTVEKEIPAETVFMCEECAKKDMGWLAKQYYERRCAK